MTSGSVSHTTCDRIPAANAALNGHFDGGEVGIEILIRRRDADRFFQVRRRGRGVFLREFRGGFGQIGKGWRSGRFLRQRHRRRRDFLLRSS